MRLSRDPRRPLPRTGVRGRAPHQGHAAPVAPLLQARGILLVLYVLALPLLPRHA